MAAVRVVLPWSMWPIVPTLQCGFVRAVFAVSAAEASTRQWAVENWLELLNRKRKHGFLQTALVEMTLQIRNKLNRPNNKDIFDIEEIQ